ncbi:MAG TPA: NAD-dependent epimerase/dehydratase family protein, partial [Prolixibacteraceae bacterium]|nr:NAD-dependent epimerase/dehydratase family protein [Prolixibacteraceae bacterium]
MKIVITGITSEIMQRFASLINREAHEVSGISRFPEKNRVGGIRMIRADLLDIEVIRPLFSDCDLVVHAAAVTHSFREKNYFEINTEATRKLVDLARACRVKRFV